MIRRDEYRGGNSANDRKVPDENGFDVM